MICIYIYIYTYLCGAPHQYRIVLEVYSSLIQNNDNMRKNVLKTVLLALLAVVSPPAEAPHPPRPTARIMPNTMPCAQPSSVGSTSTVAMVGYKP